MITQSGNIIVIGRSGTGKTTCAILRLFAMEILAKFKSVGKKNFTSELV